MIDQPDNVAPRPADSLQRVCALALQAQLYAECEPYYPFVLGAQPVRPIDLAALYAALANEGARPSPYALASVEEGGRVIYQHEAKPPVPLRSADGVAVYQLKTMLQGVVARGTASSIRALAPFVAGKTGTSENENDAWFAGFSNDVTVVVWVGHDNADRKRRTLGRGQTGGKVAVPIFEAIMKAAWSTRGAPTPLAPPSPETKQLLAGLPIDLRTGDPASPARGAFTEHFRKSSSGGVVDTQYRFVDRKAAYALRGFPSGDGDETPFGSSEPDTFEPESSDGWGRRPQLKADSDWLRPDRYRFAWPDEDGPRRPARRVDPEYLWGPREMY